MEDFTLKQEATAPLEPQTSVNPSRKEGQMKSQTQQNQWKIHEETLSYKTPLKFVDTLIGSLIKKVVYVFNASVLESSLKLKAAQETEEALVMSSARFHRHSIDTTTEDEKKRISVLDGHSVSRSITHFIDGWNSVTDLLAIDNNSINPKAQKKLLQIKQTIQRSKPFLTDFPSKNNLIGQIHTLKNGEILIFAGGTPHHSILYEITKTEIGFTLKVYNSGIGNTPSTEDPLYKFAVLEYKIEQNDVDEKIISLLALKENGDSQIEKNLSSEITKIIGSNPVEVGSHRNQDRGNCFWKCFSTWTNDQLKDCKVNVTEKMIPKSNEKDGYAHDLLTSLEKKEVSLNKFLHMVAYEKNRALLKHIFETSTFSSEPSIDEEKLTNAWENLSYSRKQYFLEGEIGPSSKIAKQKKERPSDISSLAYEFFSIPFRKQHSFEKEGVTPLKITEKEKEERAYISSLVKGIISTSAITRDAKKQQKKEEEKEEEKQSRLFVTERFSEEALNQINTFFKHLSEQKEPPNEDPSK
jgi:hypothetical protein